MLRMKSLNNVRNYINKGVLAIFRYTGNNIKPRYTKS